MIDPRLPEEQRRDLLATAGQRLTISTGLRVGDVVQVAVELLDKKTGSPFWWRSFRVVLDLRGAHWLDVLTLKMSPELDRDQREIDIRKDVVTFVPEDRWPQGVAAMHMKLLAQGKIKIGGSI